MTSTLRRAPWRPEDNLPLLPPGLIWVYVVAPLGLAALMSSQRTAGADLLQEIACAYVPFFCYGTAFHFVYRHAMPPLLVRLPSVALRVTAHLAAVVLVTCAVAFIAYPIREVALDAHGSFPGFVGTSILISGICILPSLFVQHLRLRVQAAERAAMAERQAALQAQFDALQARTDPHFLFNSLNTVAALIPEAPQQAERMLERLADLFRYALESSRTRAVPLKREVAMVSDYLELQSARFGERLRTRVDMDASLADVQVPPLLLQPLVENAILHGAARRRGGEVSVTVRRMGECLSIEVSDDGPGPGASAHSGAGSALSGIAERIRLHYAGHGELELRPRADGGCVARVVLPLPSGA